MAVGAATRTAGFTLLELLVVMVLMGIIFSFAALSMRGDDLAALMDNEAQRLATLLGLASDEAVLRGEELALYVDDGGFEFMTLALDGWQVPDDGLLRRYDLPAGIRLELDVIDDLPTPVIARSEDGDKDKDKEEAVSPQVFILSSGEMTPFSITFSADASLHRYTVSATALGEISRDHEEPL